MGRGKDGIGDGERDKRVKGKEMCCGVEGGVSGCGDVSVKVEVEGEQGGVLCCVCGWYGSDRFELACGCAVCEWSVLHCCSVLLSLCC